MRKLVLFSLVGAPLILAGCTLPSFLGGTTSSTEQSVTTGQSQPSAMPTASPGKSAEPSATAGQISLSISSPTNGSSVSSSGVTVNGKTAPLAEVMINDKEIKADSKGNFSTTISLDEGENIITVVANDADGNSAEKEITVTYAPPGS